MSYLKNMLGDPHHPTYFGRFYDENGTLIGHDSAEVMWFMQDHPEFTGPIYFDDEDSPRGIDVTEIFFPEPEEDEADEAGRVAA